MKINMKIAAAAAIAFSYGGLTGCSLLGGVSKSLYTDVPQIEASESTQQALKAVAEESSKRNNIAVMGIPASADTFNYSDYNAMALRLMSLPNNDSISAQKTALGVQMISASDQACNSYLTSISANERITKTGLGLTGLALTATAGALKQGTTTSILSNVATFAQGTESELEKELLGGKAARDIIQAVKVGREAYSARLTALLLGGLNANGDSVDPSFERFYIKFAGYHDSCGITYGLEVIEKALQQTRQDTQTVEPIPGTSPT